MTLTIEDRPHTLLELLWVREAYHLHPPGGDLPPLLSHPPGDASVAWGDDLRADWESTWPEIWHAAVAHAGRDTDRRLFDRLQAMVVGSVERAALLREFVGPDARDHFGEDVFADPSYRQWERDGVDAFMSSRPEAFADSPERRDLDALIPAWRAGLTKIVTIPCVGKHSRKIGANGLLVTEHTRADSSAFRDALALFA